MVCRHHVISLRVKSIKKIKLFYFAQSMLFTLSGSPAACATYEQFFFLCQFNYYTLYIKNSIVYNYTMSADFISFTFNNIHGHFCQ